MGNFVSQEELLEIETSFKNKKLFTHLYNGGKLSYCVFAMIIIMFIYHFI